MVTEAGVGFLDVGCGGASPKPYQFQSEFWSDKDIGISCSIAITHFALLGRFQ